MLPDLLGTLLDNINPALPVLMLLLDNSISL